MHQQGIHSPSRATAAPHEKLRPTVTFPPARPSSELVFSRRLTTRPLQLVPTHRLAHSKQSVLLHALAKLRATRSSPTLTSTRSWLPLPAVGGPATTPNEHDGHLRVTYDDIHCTIGQTARKIKERFDPDIMVSVAPSRSCSLHSPRPVLTVLSLLSLPSAVSRRAAPSAAAGTLRFRLKGAPLLVAAPHADLEPPASSPRASSARSSSVSRARTASAATSPSRPLACRCTRRSASSTARRASRRRRSSARRSSGRSGSTSRRSATVRSSAGGSSSSCVILRLPARLPSPLAWLTRSPSVVQDEVDDSRTTLGYAVAELKKDIQAQFDKLPEDKKADFPETKLAIFVGASSAQHRGAS